MVTSPAIALLPALTNHKRIHQLKIVFYSIFAGLILLSIVTWQIQPSPDTTVKIPLIWISDDNPARREQIALFNKLYPKYQLKIDPDNGGQKIIVQSLAGVGPELFDSFGAGSLTAFIKSGIAWDITDELRKRGIDVESDCWNVVVPSAVLNGRVYGFPTNAGNSAIWLNKDIFDKFHEPYPQSPWKWEQFVKVAQRLTIRDEHGRVKQFGFLGDWGLWPFVVLQWGGHQYSADGTRCTLDSPEAIAGIQFLHDLVYKYRVMPNPVEAQAMSTKGGWGSGLITLFAGGKGAMAFGGRFWLCLMRTMDVPRLGAVEMPYERVRVTLGGGRATLINKNSPRRREALDFMVYLAGKDYNELIHRQADGLSPVKRFAYTDLYLHDPQFPKEDYNAVWRDTMKYSIAYEDSPFISADMAGRIIGKQIELVSNNQKSAADAMKKAAKMVNEQIQKNIKLDPSLRARYDELKRRNN